MLKSDSKLIICKCRYCRASGHLITSCYYFHTIGEGIIQDDDPSRRFWCSLVYHFPNNLSPIYAVAASFLENLPIREFCCQSAVSSFVVGDYILDWRPDPIEGQNYYFLSQDEQQSTPKTTGKRKRAAPSRKSLEKRLLEQELLYKK